MLGFPFLFLCDQIASMWNPFFRHPISVPSLRGIEVLLFLWTPFSPHDRTHVSKKHRARYRSPRFSPLQQLCTFGFLLFYCQASSGDVANCVRPSTFVVRRWLWAENHVPFGIRCNWRRSEEFPFSHRLPELSLFLCVFFALKSGIRQCPPF